MLLLPLDQGHFDFILKMPSRTRYRVRILWCEISIVLQKARHAEFVKKYVDETIVTYSFDTRSANPTL